jgi:anti-sigma regulatory factor (Ser/Thr protein kinase)
MGKAFTNFHIEERSYVSYVKREVHTENTRAGFSEKQVAEIDIIVAELCSNLIKHAGSGEILYRNSELEEETIFEVVCIDKGPGMIDPAKMIKDGMSTVGTLGHGLGAIERLSTLSQIYSVPGVGTIVYSMVSTAEKKYVKKKNLELEIRALCINKPRETVCGDGYRIKKTENETRILFGDGLGHGEHAKDAVDKAGEFFLTSNESDPVEIIRQIHEKIRKTRGLVGTVAIFDKTLQQWRICGVGNIMVRMYSGIQYKNYMSYNGTVGLNIPNSLKASVFPIEKNQHLLMCSDGIKTRWDLTQYPTVFKYDNTILAAAVYRDHTRGNDDSSILIAKVT